MRNIIWLLSITGGLAGLIFARHLWRRHHAGQLADQLLDEVVRAKGSFRR